MILAGIDEAGYGPVLGPLVVGCCAFALEGEAADCDPAADKLPCLWKQLRRIASKNRDKKGKKIHINDSKLVYTPSAGLFELERSVLSLLTAMGKSAECMDEYLQAIAPEVVEDLRQYRWYARGTDERFPLEQEAVSIRMMANAFRSEMERNQTRCVHLAARVVPEKQLNSMFDQTRNKSSVLFSLLAIHLDELLRRFGDRKLVIFCDRQGGREHYGDLLRLMFQDWHLDSVSESDGHSEYWLRGREGQAVRIIFREKAEARCMSVAVASMISKYTREALMHRFNAWWRGILPELEPTAGYYSDGVRFLRDIEAKRVELAIPDAELIRSR